jgi:hypothetical protein
MKLFISLRPKPLGGGSNTFSHMFCWYAKETGHKVVRNILKAERAIIIAHLADEQDVIASRSKHCTIIHRLDEYFEPGEDAIRRAKHEKIIRLNKLADITVFQSNFVFENVYPHIKSQRYCIIHNGSDPGIFSPSKEAGTFIGHVSWGIDTKKRLDVLYEFITEHPDQKFLLIGRHKESSYNFDLPNVILKGVVKRKKLPRYYRMMKMLYFPSENDPCPNTVIEAVLSGVPVCYNPAGGTIELVKNCGESLDNVEVLLENLADYRSRCSARKDLYFDRVFERYLNV